MQLDIGYNQAENNCKRLQLQLIFSHNFHYFIRLVHHGVGQDLANNDKRIKPNLKEIRVALAGDSSQREKRTNESENFNASSVIRYTNLQTHSECVMAIDTAIKLKLSFIDDFFEEFVVVYFQLQQLRVALLTQIQIVFNESL